nr:uncharacterized protein LOC108007825 isoform X1 [Drosophila suzukii]
MVLAMYNVQWLSHRNITVSSRSSRSPQLQRLVLNSTIRSRRLQIQIYLCKHRLCWALQRLHYISKVEPGKEYGVFSDSSVILACCILHNISNEHNSAINETWLQMTYANNQIGLISLQISANLQKK